MAALRRFLGWWEPLSFGLPPLPLGGACCVGDSDGVVMPFMLSMTGLRELQLDRCAIDQSTM